MKATLWFDGACRGNPGPMAGGAVLQIGDETVTLHGEAGHGTNNMAEYDGLILGLRAALDRGVTDLEVRGDSQLVIRQLLGEYAVKAPTLRARFEEAHRLAARFASTRFLWVARAENAEADAAANEALDLSL